MPTTITSTPCAPSFRRISAESFVTILSPDLEHRSHQGVVRLEPREWSHVEQPPDLTAVDAVRVDLRQRKRYFGIGGTYTVLIGATLAPPGYA